MHTNQTLNLLTIDSPDKLAWPEDLKPFLASYDWKDVSWESYGFPAFHSSFNLSENQLYFESGPDNKMSLRKEEFTGQVLISTVFHPKDHDKVYIVTFELVFCKGILCENSLSQKIIKSKEDYDAGFREFMENNRKAAKISQAFWFKWIYRPYYYIIWGITVGIVTLVQFLLQCFVWFMGLFLPIKIQ